MNKKLEKEIRRIHNGLYYRVNKLKNYKQIVRSKLVKGLEHELHENEVKLIDEYIFSILMVLEFAIENRVIDTKVVDRQIRNMVKIDKWNNVKEDIVKIEKLNKKNRDKINKERLELIKSNISKFEKIIYEREYENYSENLFSEQETQFHTENELNLREEIQNRRDYKTNEENETSDWSTDFEEEKQRVDKNKTKQENEKLKNEIKTLRKKLERTRIIKNGKENNSYETESDLDSYATDKERKREKHDNMKIMTMLIEMKKDFNLKLEKIGKTTKTIDISSDESISDSQQSKKQKMRNVGKYDKSPRLAMELEKFDGDLNKFREFINLFNIIVDENKNITKTEKLYHLKKNLTGEAAKIISHLQIEEGNYKTALKLLKEKYDKPHKLKENLKNNLKEIRKAYNLSNAEENISNIKGILASLEKFENIENEEVKSIILQKFDKKVNMFIRQEELIKDKELSVKETLRRIEIFIQAEADSINNQEKDNLYEKKNTLNFFTRNYDEKRKIGGVQERFNRMNNNNFVRNKEGVENRKINQFEKNTNKEICCFCKKSTHESFKCDKISEIKDRINIIRIEKRCWKCLGNHNSYYCDKENCKYCKGPHSEYLCFKSKEKKEVRLTGGNNELLNSNFRFTPFNTKPT